ncbi:HNH endonuclease [Emcibacter nanhaiensis]|uniref:HNH endonuclease n=1 Tax=Emcibacter nanhaiensis TaxID=1505037 RepID=A0A501PFU7_9PROT|nr:HNH endonuclease [Emcibacter nanhaiensis]TPD59349.1 HNH endonuclease [Emcibacter nanhaiensis]
MPVTGHGPSPIKPEHCPALVLNADFQPLSYFPLSIWPWQTAIKAVFLDRVQVIEEYDRVIHSPSCQVRLPSVISLKEYVNPGQHPAFTRFNVFLRDRFTCQYCGHRAPNGKELTFDHVIPRRAGGKTTWENIITACPPCNMRKGGRTPEEAHMRLLTKPLRPTVHKLQNHGRSFPPNYLHESWRDFLYWDTELES